MKNLDFGYKTKCYEEIEDYAFFSQFFYLFGFNFIFD
jgi:hypothetical protein